MKKLRLDQADLAAIKFAQGMIPGTILDKPHPPMTGIDVVCTDEDPNSRAYSIVVDYCDKPVFTLKMTMVRNGGGDWKPQVPFIVNTVDADESLAIKLGFSEGPTIPALAEGVATQDFFEPIKRRAHALLRHAA